MNENDHNEDIVTVTRCLTYIGKRKWVDQCIHNANNYVSGVRFIGIQYIAETVSEMTTIHPFDGVPWDIAIVVPKVGE